MRNDGDDDLEYFHDDFQARVFYVHLIKHEIKSFTVADNQDCKPSEHSTGRYPFTPAPEEPAPEHSFSDEPLRESESDAESIRELLNPTPHQSAPIMTDQDSIKVSIEPLNDTNFTTWRYKIINALAYKGLDEYVLEDTSKYVSQADHNDKKRRATTYIRLHLNEDNANRFVGNDYKTYEPKALWDAINAHYATQSLENAANVWDKLSDVCFGEDNMRESINSFRTSFELLVEVSAGKLDKTTLETCWIFLVLKRLPSSFGTFRTLQYAGMKKPDTPLKMSSFLNDLESELRRQQEASTMASPTAPTALAVSQQPQPLSQQSSKSTTTSRRKGPKCENGVHNPAVTSHTEDRFSGSSESTQDSFQSLTEDIPEDNAEE
ncbi:hypothetical protein PCANC_06498, partial [Puccinia coronata f. sp. avenae]